MKYNEKEFINNTLAEIKKAGLEVVKQAHDEYLLKQGSNVVSATFEKFEIWFTANGIIVYAGVGLHENGFVSCGEQRHYKLEGGHNDYKYCYKEVKALIADAKKAQKAYTLYVKGLEKGEKKATEKKGAEKKATTPKKTTTPKTEKGVKTA